MSPGLHPSTCTNAESQKPSVHRAGSRLTCGQVVCLHACRSQVQGTAPGIVGAQLCPLSHRAECSRSCHRHTPRQMSRGKAGRGHCGKGQGTCGCRSAAAGHMGDHMVGSRRRSSVDGTDAAHMPSCCCISSHTCEAV